MTALPKAERKSVLEKLEERAVLVHGRGAAVSVDREKGHGMVVRVWSPKGVELVKGESRTTNGAIRKVLMMLITLVMA